MRKLQTEKNVAKMTQEEEKAYTKYFWSTAKLVTNGTFGKPTLESAFDKSTADQYYKNKYEKKVTINPEDINWFLSVDKPLVPYTLYPYKPKYFQSTLYKKCRNNAPGEDNIVYQYLKKNVIFAQSVGNCIH